MRVRWTKLAERRAEEAFAYIAAERPSAADRWLVRVLDRVERLRDHPDSGRMVPEVARPEIREVIVAPYRVMYRRDAKQVSVLTVRHARRAFDLGEVEADSLPGLP